MEGSASLLPGARRRKIYDETAGTAPILPEEEEQMRPAVPSNFVPPSCKKAIETRAPDVRTAKRKPAGFVVRTPIAVPTSTKGGRVIKLGSAPPVRLTEESQVQPPEDYGHATPAHQDSFHFSKSNAYEVAEERDEEWRKSFVADLNWKPPMLAEREEIEQSELRIAQQVEEALRRGENFSAAKYVEGLRYGPKMSSFTCNATQDAPESLANLLHGNISEKERYGTDGVNERILQEISSYHDPRNQDMDTAEDGAQFPTAGSDGGFDIEPYGEEDWDDGSEGDSGVRYLCLPTRPRMTKKPPAERLEALTVQQLREECRACGLSVTGKKQELVERLSTYQE